jgi:hypothetical protein
VDDFAVVHFEALAAWDLEAVGIEAEEVEDGGVDVSDVMALAEGVVTEFVGFAREWSLL